MSYVGDIRLGDTIDIKFSTRRFTTGAPFTLAGSPVISAYVGNGTTEITAGITLTVDFDSRTGLNNVRVVATSGNGFATATNVDLVITTGTVDSVSVVGEVVGSFSIEARSALMPTTAARTLDVTATGAAGVDWANVENPTTALNLSGTNIDVDQVVASVSGAVGSVGTGGITTASFAAGAVNAAAIGADAITAAKIADGAIDAATFAAGAINAAAIAADAITDAKVAADVTIASVTGAVGSVTGAVGSVTGNVGGNVAGSVASVTGNVAGSVASVAAGGIAASSFAAGAIDAAAIAANAIDASALATDAVTEIVNGVLDEALAGHAGAGTVGAGISAASSAGDPWSTALPGAYGAGTAGKIIGDNINATVLSRASQASVDTVDGIVDSILVDTAEIGAAGAGLTALATQASVDAIDNFVDTEVGAIKAVTDKLDTGLVLDGAVYQFTANALELAPTGGSAPTVGQIADEVQTRTIAAVTNVVGVGANAINAASLAADVATELQAGLATAAALATAQTAIDAIPTNAELATALGTSDDAVLAQVALSKAILDKLDDTLEDDGGTFRFTTNSLEQAPSGGGSLTVQDIVDGLLDEMIAGHQDAGSVGLAISDAGAGGNPWNNTMEGSVTYGDAAKVVAAYAAGKTDWVKTGNHMADVTFRSITDDHDAINTSMNRSKRIAVTLNP